MRRLVIAIAVGAVLLLAWFGSRKLHRFAYWAERHEPAAVAMLARDGWQVDRFSPAMGVDLYGLVRPPRSPQGRHVLYLPGNSGNVLAGFQEVLLRAAGDADLGFVFWAPRGFDASTGSPSPEGLAADALAGWDRATSVLGWPPERELWGYSLGAALAVEVAARLCERGTPPTRLVLLAATDVLPVMPPGLFGRFLPDHRYDALAAAPRVTCPVRIVHGTLDDALPLASARRLQAALRGPVEFTELPGTGHVDLLGVLGTLRL